MIVSYETVDNPIVKQPVAVSLDEAGTVTIQCFQYSKKCGVGQLCRSNDKRFSIGVQKEKNKPTRVAIWAPGWIVADTRMFNTMIATCKNCIAKQVQKQK